MDLKSYCLIFPQASNGYMRRNINSKSYMDLRSYCLLFPQASNRYIRRNIDSKSTWTSGATSFYFLRLRMGIKRNIDNKSYMDLRSYCLLFPQAANRYILRNIDGKSTWTAGATSFLSLRFLRDIRMNIDSKSYMDLRSYFPLIPQASNR